MPKRNNLRTASEHIFKGRKGDFSYKLIRSASRRSMTISIDEKAQVSMAVPYSLSIDSVHAFFKQKEDWVLNKLDQLRRTKQILETKDFSHGSQFLFLGKKYPLEVHKAIVKRSGIKFDGEKWIAFLPAGVSPAAAKVQIKKSLVKWYRLQAEELVAGRVFHFSRLMGKFPQKIAVRTQKRVWGNCDYNTKTLHFNWQIILSPLDVVDYVVVHELSHLWVPNHSKRFWSKVRETLPDYELRKKWLKDNYAEMLLP